MARADRSLPRFGASSACIFAAAVHYISHAARTYVSTALAPHDVHMAWHFGFELDDGWWKIKFKDDTKTPGPLEYSLGD